MAMLPTTRNQAVALAEAIGEDGLSDEQIAAFKNLYRLTDPRTIKELVIAGEISAVSDEDVNRFIVQLQRHGINNRVQLDHSRAFLRQVSASNQIALLKSELPRILRGYFLQDLMSVLNEMIITVHEGCKCGGNCSMCGLIGTTDCPECKKDGERP